MTKRSFVASLPLLASLRAMAGEGPKRSMLDHPYLSPENCAWAEPASRWASVNDEFKQEFGTSEQAQTRFFEAYAQNLRKWTQEKHPESQASRPHLEKAFTKAAEFINFSVWGVRIHFMPRFPATLEWIIWYGWQGHGQAFDVGEADARYEIEDLRSLFVVLFKANAEVWKKLADERLHVDESLAALQQAEALLPAKGRSYFRTQLAKQIAGAIINS